MGFNTPLAQMAPAANDNSAVSLVKIDAAVSPLSTSLGAQPLAGATNGGNYKASGGILFKAGMTNLAGTTRYIQVFNTTSVPANGSVPLISKDVATNAYGELDFSNRGFPLSTGITVVASTTPGSLTLAGALDVLLVVTYI